MVNKLKFGLVLCCLFALIGAWPSSGLFPGVPVNITQDRFTNDNSAWNNNEKVLTTANASRISLKATAAIDDQADAQVLIYNGSMYVVTENNTVYRINATNGSTIASRNLGTPVPSSVSGCTNNPLNMGIMSTPVIDPATNILYLVSYQYPSNNPTYKIYGVDTTTLNDKISPQVIALSSTLTDATTYGFNAKFSRQRAALKLANNNIYVGFASFCDFNPSSTRGWQLGFSKSTLSLITSGYLIDQFHPDTVDTPPFYLSSIWQSGAGPAIDANGNLFVTTGNSGSGAADWMTATNLSCTSIKFSATLTVVDFLANVTPGTGCTAPGGDNDTSGMGVLILPNFPGCVQDYSGQGGPILSCVHMSTIGTKSGCCHLLDDDNMGHIVLDNAPGPNNITLFTDNTGFYTPTYYTLSDNVVRLATCADGGSNTGFYINIRKITTPGNAFTIARELTVGQGITNLAVNGVGFQSGQDGCGNWSVSSNGTITGTTVMWVVSRPVSTGGGNQRQPLLYVMDPSSGAFLVSQTLPKWGDNSGDSLNGNMNADPVVANGHIYYCTYKICDIFGL